LHDALKIDALVPVLLEEGQTDVLGALADTFPRMEREVSGVLDGLARNLLVVLVVEGQNAAEKQIGDNTEGPVVNLLTVRLLKKDFGGNVRKRAKRILTRLVRADDFG